MQVSTKFRFNHHLLPRLHTTCKSFSTTARNEMNRHLNNIITSYNKLLRNNYTKSHLQYNVRNFSSMIQGITETMNDKHMGAGVLYGDVLDYAVDLRSARPGDTIHVPYELTVTEAMEALWSASFHSQDRITTSTPFARKIGLQDRILPFSLVLFLTSSMTHADAAKVQVGFGNAVYHWPAFAGDTFTKSFQVQSIRNTSDGHHSVIHFKCLLINQRGRVCMSADKHMLFEFSIPESNIDIRPIRGNTKHHVVDVNEQEQQLFRDHLISKGDILNNMGSSSLATLRPGQLIFHQMNRSITFSQSQQLASLARLTHPRHFDTRRYDMKTEIMIPGGLVLGLVMSSSSRDLHEILHEELLSCSYVNSLHPGDVVSAMSVIREVNGNVPGDMESVVVRTIGVKNFDLVRDLNGAGLPVALFTSEPRYKRDLEKICKEACPALSNKIVATFDRRILRQCNREEVFLL